MRRQVESSDQPSVTVHVPLQLRKRGGRKVIIGEVTTASASRPNAQSTEHKTILKALGRAYRWKRMLESGEFSSISELAKAEKINHSYVRRILRLTLLSPEITETILNHDLPKGQQLEDLLKAWPTIWGEQVFSEIQTRAGNTDDPETAVGKLSWCAVSGS